MTPEDIKRLNMLARRLAESLNKERTSNGQHRRANKTSQGGSPDPADSGTGGTKAQGASQGAEDDPQDASQGASLSGYYYIQNYIQSAVQSAGNVHAGNVHQIHYSALFGWASDAEMQKRRARGKWAPPWMTGALGVPNNALTWEPHPVQGMISDGVQAGEIHAWRAWHWNGKRLRSIFVDYEWPINGPAIGEPGNGYGIHAFKDSDQAAQEYYYCRNDVLLGTVALWGDIIEFQWGYTAEFAKVLTLPKAPKEVKALYGLKS